MECNSSLGRCGSINPIGCILISMTFINMTRQTRHDYVADACGKVMYCTLSLANNLCNPVQHLEVS